MKRLAWIAAGYAAAAAIGAGLMWARYLFIDPAIVDASSGMFAGGDLIGFVVIAGTLSLLPTFFLLKLATDHYPRAVAWFLLVLSATGPISLWILIALSTGDHRGSGLLNDLLGLAMVFFIFPRVVAIPVMFTVLVIALRLARERQTYRILLLALFLEAAPLAAIALHFLRTIH